jgi:hypothetical protein
LKKTKKHIIILGAIAVILISSVVGYNYYIDQIKTKGFIFGNELKQIQDDLKDMHEEFETQKVLWEDDSDISKQDLTKYTKQHISKLEDLILRYDKLDVPAPFISSVEFFRLSTESQIESTKEFLLWLETDDTSHKIRSDELFQESFDFELIALSHFKDATSGRNT